MPPPSPDMRLLRALRAENGHRVCSDLAERAVMEQEAVRARIAVLRGAGYDIEEHPHLGFRLLASPDRLIADDILARLRTLGLVKDITVFEETGSTNDVAARLGRAGAAAGLVIFAEKQTAGRGRLGRRWESSPGRGLWFSLLLRPELPLALWPRLTTWAAVAVARGIEGETPCRASIKWPNDIYAAGRKVAGILTETQVDGAGDQFAVLGIGVNINQEQADFPDFLAEKAGSLRMLAGGPLDRMALAAAILQRMDDLWPLLGPGFGEIVAEACARSFLAGIWVEAGGEQGRVEGLDDEGALLLRRLDGSLAVLRGGEISPRPER